MPSGLLAPNNLVEGAICDSSYSAASIDHTVGKILGVRLSTSVGYAKIVKECSILYGRSVYPSRHRLVEYDGLRNNLTGSTLYLNALRTALDFWIGVSTAAKGGN
jgi:hypothetical protein